MFRTLLFHTSQNQPEGVQPTSLEVYPHLFETLSLLQEGELGVKVLDGAGVGYRLVLEAPKDEDGDELEVQYLLKREEDGHLQDFLTFTETGGIFTVVVVLDTLEVPED